METPLYKHISYRCWANMMQRCYDPNSNRYQYYGGRGITVCERWHNSRNFIEDMGARNPGETLDRIDSNLGYFKENCRWATKAQQSQNRRHTQGCVEQTRKLVSLLTKGVQP